MQVLIRVDSSFEIGSGHVARCLVLANGLRAQGAQVGFVSRPLAGNLLGAVQEAGFALHVLPVVAAQPAATAHEAAIWFGGNDWEDDAEQTADYTRQIEGGVDWLVVDHYGIDSGWEQRLRPWVRRIAVLDDLANRSHDCDLLIDSNPREPKELDPYHALVPARCIQLLGLKYVLLRDEFALQRVSLRQRDGQLRRLLVFFGGMDASDQTSMALRAIAALEVEEWETDVVVGATNPHREAVAQFCRLHTGFHYHCQTSRMAELMASADLAIGGGGTTTWERFAVGLPSIVVTVADNQVPATLCMAAQGRLLYLGDHRRVREQSLTSLLASLQHMPHWLNLLSERSAEMLDGRGLSRVLRNFSSAALLLRLASMDDCRTVYEWRNDPQTRSVSHDHEPLSIETHTAWFRRSLENSQRILLIAEAEGQPVGVLRYDQDRGRALVSINMAPDRRGQGLGAPLLRLGTSWMKAHRPEVHTICAEILTGNVASENIFLDAGYRSFFSTLRQDF